MFRGTPMQMLAQTTMFVIVFTVGSAAINWHRFVANPWSMIGGYACGAYTVAVIVIGWRFIGTRYFDRK